MFLDQGRKPEHLKENPHRQGENMYVFEGPGNTQEVLTTAAMYRLNYENHTKDNVGPPV